MGYIHSLTAGAAAIGVDIRAVHTEGADGQLELSFTPKCGIHAADAAAALRCAAKEVAQEHGMTATFLPRPFIMSGPASGGHFNFSLWRMSHTDTKPVHAADKPVRPMSPGWTPPQGVGTPHESTFAEDGLEPVTGDGTSPDGLALEARHFLAGVLAHAPALEAFCAPTPACYTRHGRWAPSAADWGIDDRTRAVRVKTDEHAQHTYMELRMPSSAANPYLVLAAVCAAGMDGIEKQMPLPPAAHDAPTKREEQGQGEHSLVADAAPCNSNKDGSLVQPGNQLKLLPTSLLDACDALEANPVICEALGEPQIRWFTSVKRAEVRAIEAHVQKLLLGSSPCDGHESLDTMRLEAWRHAYMEFL